MSRVNTLNNVKLSVRAQIRSEVEIKIKNAIVIIVPITSILFRQ